MELCSQGHDEVCYDDSGYTQCPVCAVIDEKADQETEIDQLKERVDELEDDVKSLEQGGGRDE